MFSYHNFPDPLLDQSLLPLHVHHHLGDMCHLKMRIQFIQMN